MCFGVGIVRSVCLATRSLYVLTPLPLVVLSAHVDRLVVGRVCDLPNSLLVGSPYLAMGVHRGRGRAEQSGQPPARRGELKAESLFLIRTRLPLKTEPLDRSACISSQK